MIKKRSGLVLAGLGTMLVLVFFPFFGWAAPVMFPTPGDGGGGGINPVSAPVGTNPGFGTANDCSGGAKPADKFDERDVYCVFQRAADWMFAILMLLVVIFVIYAAYLYLTSADNPDNTEKARNQLIYAAVAIAVALLSRGVESLVRTFLGITQS